MLQDIAQLVFRINEMVTGINVAVVLYGQSSPAGPPENAKAWVESHPNLKRDVKKLNKVPRDILAHPLVKDCT